MPEVETSSWYGKAVLMMRPNWASPPGVKLDHDQDSFRGYNRAFYYSHKQTSVQTLSFEYMLEEREYISDFIDFFDSYYGRLSSFWIPSWRSDLVASAAVGETDPNISVENFQYADFYLPNDFEGRHVCLIWPDGSYMFRKIVSATNTQITLNRATSKEVTAAQLSRFMISFLYVVRFNADELKLNYKNTNFATVRVNFKSLFLGSEISATATQTTTTSTQSTTSTTSSTASTTSTTHTSTSTVSSTSTQSTTSSTLSTTSTISTTSTVSTTSTTVSATSSSSTTSSTQSTTSTHSTTSSTYSTTSTQSTTTTYTEFPGTDLFETDFREYTIDQQPNDWTERFGTAEATAIVTTPGELGGQMLFIDHDAEDDLIEYGISWDDVDGAGTIEILAKVRAANYDSEACGIFLRASGASGSEDGYFVFLWPRLTNPNLVYLYRYDSGSRIALDAYVDTSMVVDDYHWVRFQAVGDQIKVKTWRDKTSEPSSWQIEVTDSNHTSGWAGLWSSEEEMYCDYFGVMLDRSDMPLRVYTTTTTTTTTA